MPRMKFFWQVYCIGSVQLLMAGKPSTQVLIVAALAGAGETAVLGDRAEVPEVALTRVVHLADRVVALL